MRTQFFLTTILACLLGLSTASAHHSFAATFKDGEPIAVEGVVTSFSFKNPHVLIYIDVTNADGSVTNWMSEGAAATNMRSRGWSRDSFKAGDRIRIHGDPTHDGSPMVSIGSIDILDPATGELVRTMGNRRDDDAEIEIVQIPAVLDDGRPNLTGAWVQIRGGGGRRGRPDELGGEPPYNEVGAAAQALYDRSDDPQIFCEPPGVIRQSGFTPHPLRITQNDDHIVFEYEEYAGYRVVPLGDELPAPGESSHMGDSVAHYDGDALIVRTVNILSNPSSPIGHRTSDRVSTVETYKRADTEENGPVLSATMDISDPVYYDGGTWTLSQNKRYSEGYEFIENECRPPLRERKIDAAAQVADVVIPPPELPPEPEEEEGPGMLERLEMSGLSTWVAESLYGYPIVLGLHAIGLAIVVGLLIFVDLRLLGYLSDIRLSSLLGPMKLAWIGFTVNALSGFALFSSQATYIIYSTPFLIKIGMVILGAVIAYYIQRQTAKNVDSWEADSVPSSIKAVAAISLVCWMGAIIAGRLIAYL
ncbi:MAG: DUF6152 family protein [Woeseiaceae bacterium]